MSDAVPQAALDAAERALRHAKLANRTYGDVGKIAAEAAEPHIRADERHSIRHALFGCKLCGKIHKPWPVDPDSPMRGQNWASPDDGHPYSPPFFGSRPAAGEIADLLDES